MTAARELLATQGFEALTLEGVARRAGVSRTAIYKRWSSLADLMLDVATRALATDSSAGPDSMVAPDTGSLAGDLREFVLQGMGTLARLEELGVALPLLAHSVLSTSLGSRARDELFAGDEQVLTAIMQAAVERGELAEIPTDTASVFYALVGYALYRTYVLHLGLDVDELDALCRVVARGVGG